MTPRPREQIAAADSDYLRAPDTIARAEALSGVRIYDVGQGDAIAILGEEGRPVLHIDYGGRQGSPFKDKTAPKVDTVMPIDPDALVMVTHWDEDHWSSARKGTAAKACRWLVPRQTTSPRAVRFSADLPKVKCIPERRARRVHAFRAKNGDTLLWQKIQPAPAAGKDEDCNRTGVALALVRDIGPYPQAILLPGDAAFGWVPFYERLKRSGRTLTGLVAFHHGAASHWTLGTKKMLRSWRQTPGGACKIVFSCSADNDYGHPQPDLYDALMPMTADTSFDARARGDHYIDIMFR